MSLAWCLFPFRQRVLGPTMAEESPPSPEQTPEKGTKRPLPVDEDDEAVRFIRGLDGPKLMLVLDKVINDIVPKLNKDTESYKAMAEQPAFKNLMRSFKRVTKDSPVENESATSTSNDNTYPGSSTPEDENGKDTDSVSTPNAPPSQLETSPVPPAPSEPLTTTSNDNSNAEAGPSPTDNDKGKEAVPTSTTPAPLPSQQAPPLILPAPAAPPAPPLIRESPISGHWSTLPLPLPQNELPFQCFTRAELNMLLYPKPIFPLEGFCNGVYWMLDPYNQWLVGPLSCIYWDNDGVLVKDPRLLEVIGHRDAYDFAHVVAYIDCLTHDPIDDVCMRKRVYSYEEACAARSNSQYLLHIPLPHFCPPPTRNHLHYPPRPSPTLMLAPWAPPTILPKEAFDVGPARFVAEQPIRRVLPSSPQATAVPQATAAPQASPTVPQATAVPQASPTIPSDTEQAEINEQVQEQKNDSDVEDGINPAFACIRDLLLFHVEAQSKTFNKSVHSSLKSIEELAFILYTIQHQVCTIKCRCSTCPAAEVSCWVYVCHNCRDRLFEVKSQPGNSPLFKVTMSGGDSFDHRCQPDKMKATYIRSLEAQSLKKIQKIEANYLSEKQRGKQLQKERQLSDAMKKRFETTFTKIQEYCHANSSDNGAVLKLYCELSRSKFKSLWTSLVQHIVYALMTHLKEVVLPAFETETKDQSLDRMAEYVEKVLFGIIRFNDLGSLKHVNAILSKNLSEKALVDKYTETIRTLTRMHDLKKIQSKN